MAGMQPVTDAPDTTRDELEALRSEVRALQDSIQGEDTDDPDEEAADWPLTVASWSKVGSLKVETGPHRWYAFQDYKIVGVTAGVGTAPSGGPVKVDVLHDGVSIFSGSAKLQIPAGKRTADADEEDIDDEEAALDEGEYLQIKVVATNGAKDLTVNVQMLEEE